MIAIPFKRGSSPPKVAMSAARNKIAEREVWAVWACGRGIATGGVVAITPGGNPTPAAK